MQPQIQMTNAANLLPNEKNGKPVDNIAAKAKRVEYCLYARKSSEDDERQALSIDPQLKEMAIQAEAQGLRVTEIRKESHSAKASDIEQ